MASAFLQDLVLSGFCFWLLLAASLTFVFCGFWSPRQFWWVMRKPPQVTNFIFFGFALLLGYALWDNAARGYACTTLDCPILYHRTVQDEALIFWHLIGINALAVLFTVWGVVINHARERDEVARRAAIDARGVHPYAAQIAESWEASKGSATFVTLLAANELYCALDESGMYVVVDKNGAVHALDFEVLNETKAAIHDTLAGNLQGSGVEVPTVDALLQKLALSTP